MCSHRQIVRAAESVARHCWQSCLTRVIQIHVWAHERSIIPFLFRHLTPPTIHLVSILDLEVSLPNQEIVGAIPNTFDRTQYRPPYRLQRPEFTRTHQAKRPKGSTTRSTASPLNALSRSRQTPDETSVELLVNTFDNRQYCRVLESIAAH